ncbi:MAG: chromosome segregation protein SMC [Leptolinea sp.]
MPRLKSLELHGYKTFASQTLFEFPGILTAIVGPNGSGKSNIADALRWVLGEQAFSLLRGRKTEDMIFSGSEQRSRAGMASATITFNNEDGWLPIDFSEVSIARRAYRDGQNEYLLNGQRVRLKEISELLAQSGLAERTYTIIGQGLVDAALSLRPEERRRFFEEAAGIGLYRSRREESLNRLEATRRNLVRVQDIVTELEPRLVTLERQARRALEYEQVKADLRLLLRDWYGYHWNLTQKSVSLDRQALRDCEITLEKNRNLLNEYDSKLNLKKQLLAEIRRQLSEWHTQLAGLHTRQESLLREAAVKQERKRSLMERELSLQNNLANREEEMASRQKNLLEMTQEVDRLQKELEDAQLQSEDVTTQLQKLQEERRKAEDDVRVTRRKAVELETANVKIQAHRNEVVSRGESIQLSLANLEKSIGEEEKRFTEIERTEKATRLEREKAEADLHNLSERSADIRKKISESEIARRELLDARNKLETRKAQLGGQLKAIIEAESAFSGLASGAKAVLQQAKSGRLKGRYSALTSLLDVPKEYEQAIVAVMGEYLDAIFLAEDTDEDEAISWLGTSDQGRAALFPAVSLTARSDNKDLASSAGVIGLAYEKVGAPPELKKVISAALGNAWIVKDRETARKIARNGKGDVRAVTLAGEVFLSNGAVIAGREGRGSMISRPRERKELESLVADVENDLDIQNYEISKYETGIKSLRDEESQIHQSHNQAEENSRKLVQKAQKAALDLNQMRQQVDWKTQQIEQQKEQEQTSAEELLELDETISINQMGIQETNTVLREKNIALAKLSLDEIQSQVFHWNTTVAVSRKAKQEADRRLTDLLSAIDNNGMQVKELQNQIEGIHTEQSQLQKAAEEQHTQINSITEETNAVDEKINPSEVSLSRLEQDYSNLQNDLLASQQKMTAAERLTAQAKLEYARSKDGVDNLREKIEEDMGLVNLEYSEDSASQSPLPLDGWVEQLPNLTDLPPEMEENINRQKAQIRRMGAVNPEAQVEYQSVAERHEYLKTQVDDLHKADDDLRQIIRELDEVMEREFMQTFRKVAEEFAKMFTRLFGGGSARLLLTDEENFNETGIDIEARLPGRREQGLSLLSGGERSLTAVALIFALLKVSPTPFCVLDEVDAMLDEANVGRYRDLLRELANQTQFIVITHNRNTVQAADVIYGITMGRDSTSQIISLRLDDIPNDMVK